MLTVGERPDLGSRLTVRSLLDPDLQNSYDPPTANGGAPLPSLHSAVVATLTSFDPPVLSFTLCSDNRGAGQRNRHVTRKEGGNVSNASFQQHKAAGEKTASPHQVPKHKRILGGSGPSCWWTWWCLGASAKGDKGQKEALCKRSKLSYGQALGVNDTTDHSRVDPTAVSSVQQVLAPDDPLNPQMSNAALAMTRSPISDTEEVCRSLSLTQRGTGALREAERGHRRSIHRRRSHSPYAKVLSPVAAYIHGGAGGEPHQNALRVSTPAAPQWGSTRDDRFEVKPNSREISPLRRSPRSSIKREERTTPPPWRPGGNSLDSLCLYQALRCRDDEHVSPRRLTVWHQSKSERTHHHPGNFLTGASTAATPNLASRIHAILGSSGPRLNNAHEGSPRPWIPGGRHVGDRNRSAPCSPVPSDSPSLVCNHDRTPGRERTLFCAASGISLPQASTSPRILSASSGCPKRGSASKGGLSELGLPLDHSLGLPLDHSLGGGECHPHGAAKGAQAGMVTTSPTAVSVAVEDGGAGRNE